MNNKFYQIKDLSWYKSQGLIPEICEVNDDSLTIGKSSLAHVHQIFEEITTRKSQSKKLPKLISGYHGSRPIRIRELSVPLPSISKKQGNIVSYLSILNSPRICRPDHSYLKKS
jgi:hypothetical protein